MNEKKNQDKKEKVTKLEKGGQEIGISKILQMNSYF